MDIENLIINYFREKGIPDKVPESGKYDIDYILSGKIDSLGIIEMISEFENEFDIVFTQEDFDNPDFRKIDGLIKIVINKRNNF